MANSNFGGIHKTISGLTSLAVILAFVVVILGAFTRLSDAGLGCPDWPGCYGHLLVPESAQAIQQADKLFPNQPVEPEKAWAEMIHRYAAGTLGGLIIILAILAMINRRSNVTQPVAVPLALVALVIFQAALGMWTVTLQLLPAVVMGHLLGGMSILALLWLTRLWLNHSDSGSSSNAVLHRFKPWAVLGIIIVFAQVALGGWTSANYAALACPDFPFCHGSLAPLTEFHAAFNLMIPPGVNFQGGVLDNAARVTIQMTHRLGALVTALYLLWFAGWILFTAPLAKLRSVAGIVIALLLTQLLLGIGNVIFMLPLPIAVLHNATAALLLLSVVTLAFWSYQHGSR